MRRAAMYVTLTIAASAFVFFLGLPGVAKFAAFLTDLRQSGEPVEIKDTTPPVPPRIEPLPEATKELRVEIKGSTEPGVSVTLKLNGKEEEVLSNNAGEFNYTFALNDGENTISAFSRDASGNESQKTEAIHITYDNQPPELSISSPSDGSDFYGSKQRQVVLTGKTEEKASVNINGRFVVVDSGGNFEFTTTLTEGENTFEVIAHDLAGNERKLSLKLHYSP